MIAYLGDDSSVVEPYLDLSELQSQNVMNALECISFSQQYLMEEYGQEDIREDVPYEITFDSVEVKDNTCEVKISLRLLPHETDAPFLSGGEEVFHLKWLEGRWKISRHEWNGIDGFELFTDEVYQFDKEQRKKLLDDMMSWPKEGQDISEWNFEPEDECNLESGSNLITSVVPQDPLPGGIPIGNYNYNPVHGVSYAVDTANTGTFNSLFYDYSACGGDCTNFVSQCVSYGFHNGGVRSSPSSYYYSPSQWRPAFTCYPATTPMWSMTNSWVGVPEFWSFAVSNQTYQGRRFWFAAQSNPESGCVIQFYNGSSWHHSAIIYLDGTIWKVAEHSPNHSAMPLSSISYSAVRYLVPKVLYVT